MPRDNFLQKTISILRNRVANRCSNPDCRVPTTAAASDTDKTNSIGIAAHICAASPGGPRYSERMTPEERKSINNGIWLCSNCSIEIDRDEKKYTVSVLNEWKQKAEQLAKKELGNRLPSKEDTINTVAATLTGLPTKFIPTAISNVHEASSQTLEKLDPRFVIKSSHSENFTKFTVLAKKDVEVQMQIPSDNKGQFIDRHNRLINDGEDLEIDANSIKFEGSDLLKEISQIMGKGKIIISSKKIKSIQKLRLVNPENALVETFEDMGLVLTSPTNL